MALPEPIEILHEDADLLAVNKPAGLLVHRSKIANDETDFLLDRLTVQVAIPLFLAHRLDRATSGVVLLAKSREVAGELGRLFMARDVTKRYLAVVRGWPEPAGVIDYPLPDVRERSPRKPALTRWRTLARAMLPIATRVSLMTCSSVMRAPAARAKANANSAAACENTLPSSGTSS